MLLWAAFLPALPVQVGTHMEEALVRGLLVDWAPSAGSTLLGAVPGSVSSLLALPQSFHVIPLPPATKTRPASDASSYIPKSLS